MIPTNTTQGCAAGRAISWNLAKSKYKNVCNADGDDLGLALTVCREPY